MGTSPVYICHTHLGGKTVSLSLPCVRVIFLLTHGKCSTQPLDGAFSTGQADFQRLSISF